MSQGQRLWALIGSEVSWALPFRSQQKFCGGLKMLRWPGFIHEKTGGNDAAVPGMIESPGLWFWLVLTIKSPPLLSFNWIRREECGLSGVARCRKQHDGGPSLSYNSVDSPRPDVPLIWSLGGFLLGCRISGKFDFFIIIYCSEKIKSWIWEDSSWSICLDRNVKTPHQQLVLLLSDQQQEDGLWVWEQVISLQRLWTTLQPASRAQSKPNSWIWWEGKPRISSSSTQSCSDFSWRLHQPVSISEGAQETCREVQSFAGHIYSLNVDFWMTGSLTGHLQIQMLISGLTVVFVWLF